MVTVAMLAPWKKSYDQPRQHIKKQRYYLANKGPPSQSYDFSSSQVCMRELEYKENWAPKNWCFWILVLKKTLESPLDCKKIQPVDPKGNQSWIFIGRTDAEAETPVLWPSDAKNWLIRKDPDAGKDWRQEEKRMTEDKMVGWHHQFHGHEFEQARGVGDGQGSLVCCSPRCCRVGHNWMTEPKNKIYFKKWKENKHKAGLHQVGGWGSSPFPSADVVTGTISYSAHSHFLGQMWDFLFLDEETGRLAGGQASLSSYSHKWWNWTSISGRNLQVETGWPTCLDVPRIIGF